MQIQNIKTPGVYVQEISTLAPSVAPVATAIPVFVGYTEKNPTNSPIPIRIDTLLDYENLFGGPYLGQPTVKVTDNPTKGLSPILSYTPDSNAGNFLMYYGLSLYFQNGGGSCYISSVGNYIDTSTNTARIPNTDDFAKALAAIQMEDEPTIIVLLDATKLSDTKQYYSLCTSALGQCSDLGDRFLLVDLPDGAIKDFRDNIGSNNLSYGAAYYPYLNTLISEKYDEKKVIVDDKDAVFAWSSGKTGFTVSFTGVNVNTPTVTVTLTGDIFNFAIDANYNLSITSPSTKTAKDMEAAWNKWQSELGNDPKGFGIVSNEGGSSNVTAIANSQKLDNITTPTLFTWSPDNNAITVSYVGAANETPSVTIKNDTAIAFAIDTGSLSISIPSTQTQALDLAAKWKELIVTNDRKGFDIVGNSNGKAEVSVKTKTSLKVAEKTTLSLYKHGNTSLYNQIRNFLSNQYITLPPSPAIAGIYAQVDRERGVWKAPANVSLNGVIGPLSKISDTTQEDLNIDTNGGKSINAIRSFTGKGTLVWGARTLDGNSNEWRYVSVRRLFINIEESARKASAFAVFEPNDATTWLKVKAMIESYLYGLWQMGALAGPKPESAYFVSVGLGKSMTAQDILDGRMIVNIGVAAVRPAEFIILSFSHKMQEA